MTRVTRAQRRELGRWLGLDRRQLRRWMRRRGYWSLF